MVQVLFRDKWNESTCHIKMTEPLRAHGGYRKGVHFVPSTSTRSCILLILYWVLYSFFKDITGSDNWSWFAWGICGCAQFHTEWATIGWSDGRGMLHSWETCEMRTELWSGNLKGRDLLGAVVIDGGPKDRVWGHWLDSRDSTSSGGLLWTRHWTFGFHKRPCVAEQLLASQEGPFSVNLVTNHFRPLHNTYNITPIKSPYPAAKLWTYRL
jgi:hypothetical protein